MPLVSITYMRDDHLFKKINSTKMYTLGHPVLFSRVQKLNIQKKKNNNKTCRPRFTQHITTESLQVSQSTQ